jgi:hypothetical protein
MLRDARPGPVTRLPNRRCCPRPYQRVASAWMSAETRTWQVIADVIFPNHVPLEVDDKGQPRPPRQLTPHSRIPVGHRRIGGADVFIYEAEKSHMLQIRDDIRFALGGSPCVSNARPGIRSARHRRPSLLRPVARESVVPDANPLLIQALRAIDLTGPPSVGEEREFGQCSGFALPTCRPTAVPMQSLSPGARPRPRTRFRRP